MQMTIAVNGYTEVACHSDVTNDSFRALVLSGLALCLFATNFKSKSQFFYHNIFLKNKKCMNDQKSEVWSA